MTLAVACAAGSAWIRWGMKKEGLGGPCSYKMHCGDDAPTCMRANENEPGVCTRPCDPGVDCAPGIACVSVGLDERDEMGRPKQGGYCVPEDRLPSKKRKHADAGASGPSGHLEIPTVAGQLEGEVELRFERAGAAPRTGHYVVKGTLARTMPSGASRTVSDAASMRTFSINDDKKTFAASALEGGGAAEPPKLVKTETKDTVAGEPCEVWRLEEAKSVHEVCVITGGAFVEPTARLASPWQKELAVRSAFALRMVERDAKGTEKSRMTVTKLDRRPQDASLFEVPRSYKNLASR